jgi:hypothetical protein
VAEPHPIPKHPAFKDLAGLPPFGQLTAKFYAGPCSLHGQGNAGAAWLCECTCGNTLVVRGASLSHGLITRCPECRSPTAKPAERECTECRRVLPFDAEHFKPAKRFPFGLRPRCLECFRRAANRYAKGMRGDIRLKVLKHYSNGMPACACCGETVWEFLALDHINGGGCRERREHKGQLFRHLVRAGFPPGYRVLCHNCNQCIRIYGYCVHKPPEGVTEHFPLYTEVWRLEPTVIPGVPSSACQNCRRLLPRTAEFYATHHNMADGLINQCRDCERHHQTNLSRKRRLRWKRLVFGHYCQGSSHCACCKLATFEFLTIDHVNGDGAAHRREINTGQFSQWVIRNNFPAGLQALCHCCNHAKGCFGRCPHEYMST